MKISFFLSSCQTACNVQKGGKIYVCTRFMETCSNQEESIFDQPSFCTFPVSRVCKNIDFVMAAFDTAVRVWVIKMAKNVKMPVIQSVRPLWLRFQGETDLSKQMSLISEQESAFKCVIKIFTSQDCRSHCTRINTLRGTREGFWTFFSFFWSLIVRNLNANF